MQRFKNVLLYCRPGPGEARLLERAADVVRANQGRLTVVDVVPRAGAEVAALRDAFMRERREELEALAQPHRGEDVAIEVRLLEGKAFLQIIREVLRRDHDLVMLVAGDDKRGSGPFFGSTAMHLMRKCPCAVWVMRNVPLRRYERLLAAVDTDPYDYPGSNENARLNVKILELATSLADRERGTLHVAHAWESNLRFWLRRPSGMSKEEQAAYDQRIAAGHRKEMDKLTARFPLADIPHQVHLLRGDAADVIAALAKTEQVDVIVMGTVCRTGVPGFFIGNTAESVLQLVRCAVLCVKPDGFVSPVSLES